MAAVDYIEAQILFAALNADFPEMERLIDSSLLTNEARQLYLACIEIAEYIGPNNVSKVKL